MNIGKSILIKDLHKRVFYLRPLVKRLAQVPQLFPVNYNKIIRNRLTHVLNMEKIISRLFSTEKMTQEISLLYRKIKYAILLHDIGHPPFGHAGERALSKIMQQFGGFSNSKQSEKLLFSSYDLKNVIGMRSIFDTKPMPLWVSFSNANDEISYFVKFIDDLENTFGDLHDIIYSIHCKASKKLFNLLLPMSCLNEPVYSMSLKYIKKISPKMTVQRLMSLINNDAEEWLQLKRIRDEITEIITSIKIIRAHDDQGYQLVSEYFHKTKNILINHYYLNDPLASTLASDFTASFSVCDIPSHNGSGNKAASPQNYLPNISY